MRYYVSEELDGTYCVRDGATDRRIGAASDDKEELGLRVRRLNVQEVSHASIR